ncbi:MAG: fumarylacetoacetate hydrolase [Aeromicrobium sp.]|nr:fumarylacetoacetate hydrolase [Aeromicrobium sp.]
MVSATPVVGDMAGEFPGGHCLSRIWLPAERCSAGIGGPTVAIVQEDGVWIGSFSHDTMSDVLDRADLLQIFEEPDLVRVASVEEAMASSRYDVADERDVRFLAPVDLQVIKACGVTFAASLLERVIEERAKGDPQSAAILRDELTATVGAGLSKVRPGSEGAQQAKEVLVAAGMWSQYLEVGIGPHAEAFTKAPLLSAVGTGARVGVRSDSHWNNPEPEIVLVVDSGNRVRGATIGNDVNLRDFEGRSALLLGEAKDNNASCAIGPWIRVFDEDFTEAALMAGRVEIEIHGTDGWSTSSSYALSEMSRPVAELVHQVGGATHQYPDGYALFLGTGFAPSADRDQPGAGFTHHPGDRVEIRHELIGTLTNWVGAAEELPPWEFGVRALWNNLDARRS